MVKAKTGAAPDIVRALSELRLVLAERGLAFAEVDRRAGWGRHYTADLISGRKTATLEQVVSMLRAAGVEPGLYFSRVWPTHPSSTALESAALAERMQAVEARLTALEARQRQGQLAGAAALAHELLGQVGERALKLEDVREIVDPLLDSLSEVSEEKPAARRRRQRA